MFAFTRRIAVWCRPFAIISIKNIGNADKNVLQILRFIIAQEQFASSEYGSCESRVKSPIGATTFIALVTQ